jgi:Tol biopolymer transport system component
MRRITIGLAATCLIVGTTGVSLGATPSAPPAGDVAGGRIVYAFTPQGGQAHVFTMAPDGSDVVQVTPFESGWAIPSPDGSRLAVPQPVGDERQTTAILGLDGSDLRTLPLPDDSTISLTPSAWSPDGGRIALEGSSDADPSLNGIHLLDIDAETVTRVTTVEQPWAHDVPVAFSPDGRSLLVVRLPDGSERGDLFVLRLDDRSWHRVSPDGQLVWVSPFTLTPASWSPDGATIAYAAFLGATQNSGIFVVGADAGDPVQVSDWGPFATGVVFSPDGKWLLYDMGVDGGAFHQLHVVRPDGTDRQRITDLQTTGSGNCCGAWSSTGREVVFQNGDDATSQLWTMGRDGGPARQVTSEPGFHAYYSWTRPAE